MTASAPAAMPLLNDARSAADAVVTVSWTSAVTSVFPCTPTEAREVFERRAGGGRAEGPDEGLHAPADGARRVAVLPVEGTDRGIVVAVARGDDVGDGGEVEADARGRQLLRPPGGGGLEGS